ncbi:hypothetical protein ACIRD3_03335 [Kitasatospora sp. NPDC093550]|uniref:hypothetical protein n=1 Tax=Kitasatospora sp. NPDC093550 TaxID=3364089 RepID=UPI0037FACBF1
MNGDNAAVRAVGIRSLQEVFDALTQTDCLPAPSSHHRPGVTNAYRWTLGTRIAGPVTRAAVVGNAVACRTRRLAECQASAVEIRHGAPAQTRPDDALGAHQATAWMSGHHDEHP